METQARGEWGSRIGFICAAAGSAVGLGNIWRFPYITGQNGGAAFVFMYVAIVFLLGMPYMLAELALGRSTTKNPVGAIQAVRPGSPWRALGFLGVLSAVGILSFYSVIAGWTLGYIVKMFAGSPGGFKAFIANPWLVVGLHGAFMVVTALIVYGGVEKGIEKWSKILMPFLFLLLIALAIYANSLEGSSKGLVFYLKPDFSKITGRAALAALGQAFFSLSIGLGLMTTYGSYVSKKENMAFCAFFISMSDTLAAFLAGLIIFPALFAMGKDPAAGPTLVFVVLPELFAKMPAGSIVGGLFFILLAVAALTSTISLLEVLVSFLVDERKASRRKMVPIAAAVTFLVGLPSALSQGSSGFLTNLGLLPRHLCDPDTLSHMSFIFGDVSLALGGFLFSIFIGWVWGIDKAASEVATGSPGFRLWGRAWTIVIRYVCPVIVFLILLNLFFKF